jgi:hypothetical protein
LNAVLSIGDFHRDMGVMTFIAYALPRIFANLTPHFSIPAE